MLCLEVVKIFRLFGVLLIALSNVDGANILGLFGSPSPSHLIVHLSLVKTLADRGHNITIITSLKPKITHENITQILIEPSPEQDRLMKESMAQMATQKNDMISTLARMFTANKKLLEAQYDFINDPRLTSLYDDPNTEFDLLIFGYCVNTFQIGVAAKFNVPIIVNWVGVPLEMTDVLVGNVRDPAYVPNVSLVLKQGEIMSFGQRLKNLLTHWFFKIFNAFIEWRMSAQYTRAFGHESNFPTFDEMKQRISLMFNNYHSHSEGPIRPIVPTSIEIGGIQVKEKPDPLPQNIQNFMQQAKHGVIFFSLGSNLQGSYINPEIIKTIYKTLSSVKQHVIWKWENLDKLPGNSSNILYEKWLPQDDILAHPKVKLFINHAGKGGIAESQYHGVPMLSLPVFADQPGNAKQMTSAGFGLSLDLQTLSEIEFKTAINEILENPKYLQNVQKFSQLYRDRPLTARESVVFWTEYVLRHRGALHLQSPVVKMGFVERNNLDVYVLLLLLLLIVVFIGKIIVRLIYQKLTIKTKKQPKFKSN